MYEPHHPDERRLSSANLPVISRHRRHSTVSSYSSRQREPYYLPSSLRVKFKRKRAFMAGITLAEAQDRIRLSSNDAYTMHDLHADSRNRIHIQVTVRDLSRDSIRILNLDVSSLTVARLSLGNV
jgi:hypothetical protein